VTGTKLIEYEHTQSAHGRLKRHLEVEQPSYRNFLNIIVG